MCFSVEQIKNYAPDTKHSVIKIGKLKLKATKNQNSWKPRTITALKEIIKL